MSDKTPAFCSRCGKPLIATTKTLEEGFDPFTGKPLPTEIPMLVCPDSHEPHWEMNPANTDPKAWEPWEG